MSSTHQDPVAPEETVDAVEEPAWIVPRHARYPAWLLAALMVALWSPYMMSGSMAGWGVSGASLAQGHYENILLHMFAHGGILHIAMNMFALIAVSDILVSRMGDAPAAWLRYFGLFLLCGVCGAALYVGLHPTGNVPVVGASGAIYGLFGLLLRLSPEDDALVPIRSTRMRKAAVELLKQNIWLFLILSAPAFLIGHPGGLAWEAHLGGFLAGLFLGPLFLAKRSTAERPLAEA